MNHECYKTSSKNFSSCVVSREALKEIRETSCVKREAAKKSQKTPLAKYAILSTLHASPSFRFFSPFTLHPSRLNRNGFTLLELLGVIAIIAILGAVISPKVINHLNAAARDAELETLEGIAHAIEVYLHENRAWPPDLDSLSPEYVHTNTIQITQNKAGFPRYYIPHPTMNAFTNAAGLASSDLGDARFLLISNIKADAAPTITNAAEFDAWWNTDETTTPNLKIHRGNVGDVFRLLNLSADVAGGSYQIDGVSTNPGCGNLTTHSRYHLPGTVVKLDEAGTFSTPEVQIAQAVDLSYRFNCGHAAGSQWRKDPGRDATCWSFWLTTENDVSGSGAPCLNSWADAEVIQFGHPNLMLEPGATNGTFSSKANMEIFSLFGLPSLHAIHYVAKNITVGTTVAGGSSFGLLAGDLLLSHEGVNELIGIVWTNKQDVFVFRPTTPGDYSLGIVYMLLDNPTGQDINALSLIETDTVVGDTTLSAGAFLVGDTGVGTNDIKYFVPTSVGEGTTSGTLSILLDGFEFGIDNSNTLQGLDLIEETITVGGVTLPSGTIVVTLQNDDTVGTNNLSTLEEDIFYLNVTSTEIGSGTSAATATLLMEGADVNLESNDEVLYGLSLAPTL